MAFCEFESNRYDGVALTTKAMKRARSILAAEVFAATFLANFFTVFLPA